jgi:carboxypeptidase C (cathepsin A)
LRKECCVFERFLRVAKYASGAHELTFLTVKGAGHMSPQWKPLATITWLTRWLNGSAI